MRTPKGTAQHVSGGVTFYLKDVLVSNNIIFRIFTDMSECVVLLIDSISNDGIHDIVIIFTFVAPERSLFTPLKMMILQF